MLPEGFTLAGILEGGATGILGLLVLLIFLGKLRPVSAFTELREDSKARVEEIREIAQSWRDAYELAEASRREQEETLAQMLEVVRTTQAVVNAVRSAVPPGGERDEEHISS